MCVRWGAKKREFAFAPQRAVNDYISLDAADSMVMTSANQGSSNSIFSFSSRGWTLVCVRMRERARIAYFSCFIRCVLLFFVGRKCFRTLHCIEMRVVDSDNEYIGNLTIFAIVKSRYWEKKSHHKLIRNISPCNKSHCARCLLSPPIGGRKQIEVYDLTKDRLSVPLLFLAPHRCR